jgi:O-antigen/teichoic acid export membrane protein
MTKKFFLHTIISRAGSDKFVTNSFVFFVGSFLAGIGNYIYQMLSARLLPIEAYGELQSLLAILAVIAVLTSAFSTTITKYTADFRAREENRKIVSLFQMSGRESLTAAGTLFLLFALASRPIADFLKIDSVVPLLIAASSFLFSFSSAVNSGIIRGLQKFRELSIISFLSVIAKIILIIVFIRAGWALNGAIGAVVAASLFGYLVSFFPLTNSLKKGGEALENKKIFHYFFPVFFTMLFTTLLSNADIILVKHFFSPSDAGQYGALTMMGHVVFFLTGPISAVMFPMAAAAHASNDYPAKVLKRAIVLTILAGSAVVLLYFIFPGPIVKMLIGGKFLFITKYLGWFGLAMLWYSLASLLANYFLSVGHRREVYLAGIGAVLQIVLLFFFHSSIGQVVLMVNIAMATVLALMIFYFIKIYYSCPPKCPSKLSL